MFSVSRLTVSLLVLHPFRMVIKIHIEKEQGHAERFTEANVKEHLSLGRKYELFTSITFFLNINTYHYLPGAINKTL